MKRIQRNEVNGEIQQCNLLCIAIYLVVQSFVLVPETERIANRVDGVAAVA